MEEEYLFKNVEAKNHKIGNNIDNKIRIKDKLFSVKSIYKILEHIKWIEEKNINRDFKIIIDSIHIVDQVVLRLFESIIYYIMKKLNLNVKYNFKLDHNVLGYLIFKTSLVYKYNGIDINSREYIKEYERDKTITQNHFRKRCTNKEEISEIMTDVSIFLKNLEVSGTYEDELTEMITEILDNAIEHSNSTGLLSITVLKDKNGKKMIDIVVLDYSNFYIGSGIKKYIESENKEIFSENNKIVLDAYDNHKKYFNDKYNIDDFSMVSAFQKKVTSRANSSNQHGTGLTTFIKSLINKSIANYCYVCSGTTMISFKEDFIKLSDEGLVGFNKDNDYIRQIPDDNVLERNYFNVNVTAYSLQFIFEGE